MNSMSSASTVCQGLQSSMEPLVRLKLTPPRPTYSDPQEKFHIEKTITITTNNNNNNNNKADMAGWSFLESLTNPNQNTTKTEPETENKVYVHPLVRRSSSVLSPKSLEMCTESLGSETGSEIGSDIDICVLMQSDDISLLSLESEKTRHTSSKLMSTDIQAPKRSTRSGTTTFPPPLTSISGSNGVQVRPHREGGRLVLKAVSVPTSPAPYFHAERSNGRLRLRLLKEEDVSPNCEENQEAVGEDVVEDNEEEWGVKDDVDDNQVVEFEDGVLEMEAENEAHNCEEEEEEENSGDICEHCETEDMEGNSGNVVGENETGMGKLPMPSRCKEGGRGNNKIVMNWPKSFWVAT